MRMPGCNPDSEDFHYADCQLLTKSLFPKENMFLTLVLFTSMNGLSFWDGNIIKGENDSRHLYNTLNKMYPRK